MGLLRKALDLLYWLSAALAAVCLIAILFLIVVQMAARWTGEVFAGAPDYASYAMAAASFLAFASALNKGSHIRVSIVLNMVSERTKFFLEVWCFGIGTAVGWYIVYYINQMLGYAIKFNDVSQGQDATPVWIAQMPVLIGSIVLAIALTDNLITLLITGKHRIIRDVTDTPAE